MNNMQTIESIFARRSIRGFLDKPVPRSVIEEVLRISQRAISGMNVQPWRFHILSGEMLELLRKSNIDSYENDNGSIVGASYQGVYRERQVAIAKKLMDSMGIRQEDKAAKSDWSKRGFRYFDAPAALILTVDSDVHQEKWTYFGIGSFSQNFCLAAQEFGLGTCTELQGVYYSENIKKTLGIGANETLIISIAFGYPDWTFPANQVVSDREKLEQISVWHGF